MRLKSILILGSLGLLILPTLASAQATCGDTLVCIGTYAMAIKGQKGTLGLWVRSRGNNAIQAYSPYNPALIASSSNSYGAKIISKWFRGLYVSGHDEAIIAEAYFDASSSIKSTSQGDGHAHGVEGRALGGVEIYRPPPPDPTEYLFPAGVYGYGLSGYGVWGETDSADSNISAVYGLNEGSGAGGHFVAKNSSAISCHTYDADSYGLVTSCNVYIGGKLDLGGAVDPVIGERFEVIPDEEIQVGDVMVIDEDSQYLTRCAEEYDTKVIGVIGPEIDVKDGETMIITFGNRGAKPVPDMIGETPERVIIKIKVDAKYGAIKRGDLLTTSPTPGHAMKAVPIEIQGRKIFPPGTIIGKALESLESGTGLIEVFVMNM